MGIKTFAKLIFWQLSFIALFSLNLYAAVYNIGPGQTYTSISDFSGWTSLQPGDTVRIHYGTYKEFILLCQSGTATNPITIEGVPDANGNRPILDGDNMVIPSQFDGHLSEYDIGSGMLAQGYGLIFIERSRIDDGYGTRPEHIIIKNLEIKSTTPESYTFTNTNGVVQSYPNGNAGIYVRNGKDILIENCVIHDTGNGFEVQGSDTMAQNITVRKCHIYNFGRTDGRKYLEHGLYTEASNMTVEYSIIGPAREGTANSTFKSRGAGTVLRYCILYSASRCLDFVEPENQSSYNCDGSGYTGNGMHDESGFSKTFVYGNVFLNMPQYSGPSSNYPIHYGYDNCPATTRNGILYFYNNTVIQDFDSNEAYYQSTFDLAPEGTIALYNNVFMLFGTSRYDIARHSKSKSVGTLQWLGGNWVTDGCNDLRPTFTGTWVETVPIINGSNTGVLTNPLNGDYTIPSGSPLLGKGVPLPAEITTDHNVNLQYVDPRSYVVRANVEDIGAFGSTGEGCPTPQAPLNFQLVPTN